MKCQNYDKHWLQTWMFLNYYGKSHHACFMHKKIIACYSFKSESTEKAYPSLWTNLQDLSWDKSKDREPDLLLNTYDTVSFVSFSIHFSWLVFHTSCTSSSIQLVRCCHSSIVFHRLDRSQRWTQKYYGN